MPTLAIDKIQEHPSLIREHSVAKWQHYTIGWRDNISECGTLTV